MKRALTATAVAIAVLVCSAVAFGWPLKEDAGYAAYRKPPCDKCVPGITPALSRSTWVTGPCEYQRQPDRPWLHIRVNHHETDPGEVGVVLDGEFMLPVTAASEFGLSATRSALDHRRITLTGGRYVVKMRIGSRNVQVGNKQHRLDVSPKWHNGKAYMPIESLSELLEWQYVFDPATGFVSVETTDRDVVSYRNSGGRALQRDKFDQAIEQYQNAIDVGGDDGQTHLKLAEAYQGRAEANERLAASHNAICEAMQRIRHEKQRLQNQPAASMDLYRAALRTAANRIRRYRMCTPESHPRQTTGRLNEALSVYSNAVMVDPKIVRKTIDSNPAAVSFSQLDEAISVAQSSARENKQRARSDYNNATDHYRRAVELPPNTVTPYLRLAGLQIELDNPRAAQRTYEEALSIDNQFTAAHIGLVEALIAEGDMEKAATEARKIIAGRPDNAAAHSLVGYAMKQQGKMRSAKEGYRKAIKLDGEFASAYNNLGVLYFFEGQTSDAVKALHRCVTLQPDSATAYANYASALGRGITTGEASVSEAMKAWQNAVDLEPSNCQYHAGLADILFVSGAVHAAHTEAALALDWYQTGTSADHARATAETTLAWCLLEEGRLDEAIETAKTAENYADGNIEAMTARAIAHVEKLQPQMAITCVRNALEAEREQIEKDGSDRIYGILETSADGDEPERSQQSTKRSYLRAAASAAHALAGNVADAREYAEQATGFMRGDGSRWTWYLLGRAFAALGTAPKAVYGYQHHPQPVEYNSARKQLIANYMQRHQVQPQRIKHRVQVSINSRMTDADRPVLKIVNNSDTVLSVLIDYGPRQRAQWLVPANGQKQEKVEIVEEPCKIKVATKDRVATPFTCSQKLNAGQKLILNVEVE